MFPLICWMRPMIAITYNVRKNMHRHDQIDMIIQQLNHRNDVAAAYLFGSFPKEPIFNDIDLLILYHKQLSHAYSDYEISDLIATHLNISTDSIDLIPFDLNKVSPLILIRAVTDGILIKDSASDYLSDQLEALSQYFIENEPCLYYRNQYLVELYSND